MTKYLLIEQNLEENSKHKTYGICIKNGSEDRKIHGISTDKIQVQQLVDKFNRYELSSEHIDIAIEDYLYDLSVD